MESRDIISFHFDIRMEILLRMPLKTIFKLKCVSKGWNNFISQPSFQKQYRDSKRQSKHLSGLFFYAVKYSMDLSGYYISPPVKYISLYSNKEHSIQDKNFEYMDNLGYVMASSNGLLLLWHSPTSYSVCDPFTKKHVKLPKTNRTPFLASVGFLCEVSDRDDGFSIHYKLVCISHGINEVTMTRNMETYSSETGEWKESLVSASSDFQFCTKVAKVIKGVFYWFDKGRRRVVVYDPKNIQGRLRLIEFPLLLNDGGFCSVCEARDGKAQFIQIYQNIEVWVLDEEKNTSGTDFIGASCWTWINKISLTNLGFDSETKLIQICLNPLKDHEIVSFLNGDVFVIDWQIKSRVRVATDDFEVVPWGFKHYKQQIWPLLL